MRRTTRVLVARSLRERAHERARVPEQVAIREHADDAPAMLDQQVMDGVAFQQLERLVQGGVGVDGDRRTAHELVDRNVGQRELERLLAGGAAGRLNIRGNFAVDCHAIAQPRAESPR